MLFLSSPPSILACMNDELVQLHVHLGGILALFEKSPVGEGTLTASVSGTGSSLCQFPEPGHMAAVHGHVWNMLGVFQLVHMLKTLHRRGRRYGQLADGIFAKNNCWESCASYRHIILPRMSLP